MEMLGDAHGIRQKDDEEIRHEKSRANRKAKDIASIIEKQNYEIKKERQVNGAGFVC